ncbi:MAG: endonuclease/exonuclease/phosphatase family protein [Opitutaceae bacterium]
MRIVTLNMWKNEGDLPRRLIAIAEGLRALNPDVVLLQEVFRTMDDAVHSGRSLAEDLGLTLVYAPARRKPRRWQNTGVMSESGLAVLVRGLVDAHKHAPLPGDERGGERIALFVRALVGEARVSVASVHLSHLRDDDAGRRDQLAAVFMDAFWRQSADVRVAGGDCNATIESLALDTIAVDPAFRIQPIPMQRHVRSTHPFPLRADRSGRLIDHLFLFVPLDGRAWAPPPSRLALDEPIRGVQPSDHAAVIADLSLA